MSTVEADDERDTRSLFESLRRYIIQPESIRALFLEGLHLAVFDATALGALPNLEVLSLADNDLQTLRFSAANASAAASKSTVPRTVVRAPTVATRSFHLTSSSTSPAAALPRLHSLNLRRNRLTEDGVPASLIGDGYFIMSVVDARDNPYLSNAGLAAMLTGLVLGSLLADADSDDVSTAPLWLGAVNGTVDVRLPTVPALVSRGLADIAVHMRKAGSCTMQRSILELAQAAVEVVNGHPRQLERLTARWKRQAHDVLTTAIFVTAGAAPTVVTTEGFGLSSADLNSVPPVLDRDVCIAIHQVVAGLPFSTALLAASIILHGTLPEPLTDALMINDAFPAMVVRHYAAQGENGAPTPTADEMVRHALLKVSPETVRRLDPPSSTAHGSQSSREATFRNSFFSRCKAKLGVTATAAGSPHAGTQQHSRTVASAASPAWRPATTEKGTLDPGHDAPQPEHEPVFHQTLSQSRPRVAVGALRSLRRSVSRGGLAGSPLAASPVPRPSTPQQPEQRGVLFAAASATRALPTVGDVITSRESNVAWHVTRVGSDGIVKVAQSQTRAHKDVPLSQLRRDPLTAAWSFVSDERPPSRLSTRTPTLQDMLAQSQQRKASVGSAATPARPASRMVDDSRHVEASDSAVQLPVLDRAAMPTSPVRLRRDAHRSWTDEERKRLDAAGADATERLVAADAAWRDATGSFPGPGVAYRCAAASYYTATTPQLVVQRFVENVTL
jgi:hypothetical protein